MKISCILTSFNRPNFVQQALRSVAAQSYKNYELLVCDDSTVMDVRRLVSRFHFPSVQVFRFKVEANERCLKSRLGVNINYGLRQAKGDIVCYLADDDYFWPDWFQKASDFFSTNPGIFAGYGSLTQSISREMDFSQHGAVRFPGSIVREPAGKLDHTQVVHRLGRQIFWPENFESIGEADAIFFTSISRFTEFHPIHAQASVKRLHEKNLQKHIEELRQGKLENLRD